MNNLIVLCPPKILLQHSASDLLAAAGEAAVFFTCASGRDALTRHLPESFVVHYSERFNDNPQVELEVYQAARQMDNPLVVALAEIDLLRAARVNDRLGVTEGCEARVHYYRDKFLMKTRAAESGIPVAAMSTLNHATELDRFIEQHGYPVVAKPRDGRGSNGVTVIRNDEDAKAYLARQDGTSFFNLMVETFVKGEHYQTNGLFVGGRPVLISTSKALSSCLDFLAGEALGLQMLEPDSPLAQRIASLATRLITEVLPSEPTMLFHLEVFVRPDGEIVLGEIACRLGGCFVNDEHRAAWGLDLRMAYLAHMRDPEKLAVPIQRPAVLAGQLLVPPMAGKLLSAPTQCDWDYVEKYAFTGRIGEVYTPMAFTNGEIMSAIVLGRTESEVESRLGELHQWFVGQADWAPV
ncbi:ATP-grasp domain-containing protein [Photobacterium atrarenae]|uniref:ATP-grasp domain-containing protein n=1 Tax=Photobacterium atrarenae TaxID=865757 RepID=A0ABY5GQ50_9GAMM|nr:ATP-grasp domain-containing protein [Photobacterium atrarenae]UTV30789.1 ATP-grasp domain-containing protein [Photobacterium atrarenae]